MSEQNSGEKTEQPTQKKRDDAHKKGQTASSRELNSISGLIVLVLILIVIIKYFFAQYQIVFEMICRLIEDNNVGSETIINSLYSVCQMIFIILVPPIVCAGVVSALTQVLQLGKIVIKENFLSFQPQCFNPVNNFKNICSLKNLITLLRQVAEIGIMCLVAIFIIKNNIRDLVSLYDYQIDSILWLFAEILGKIFFSLLGIHFVASIFDLIVQKRSLTKKLMMSLFEVKQEDKNTNGNSEIKNRRKELHREIMQNDNPTITNASLILANPTHIAIVLLYSPKKFKLPIVIAKASGGSAFNIFNLAKKYEIPIIRDKWLARSLFSLAVVGKFVPKSLLPDVAAMISKNIDLLPKVAQEIAEVAAVQASQAGGDQQLKV